MRGRSHRVRSYATDVCDMAFIASKIAGRAVFVDVARLAHAQLGLTAYVPASWLKFKYTVSVILTCRYEVYLSKLTPSKILFPVVRGHLSLLLLLYYYY